MRSEQFVPTQRRHVVRAEGGYWAFVPPPLPPDVPPSVDLMRRLSAADRALGELAGVGRELPNPHLLSRALLRREAVLSSRIEGKQASLSDLVLFEISGDDARGDAREVYNYLQAVDHVLDPDRRLPLSLSLLAEAHQILLTGVRGGYRPRASSGGARTGSGSPGRHRHCHVRAPAA